MTIQTSLLFNSTDTLNNVLIFLTPESCGAFADTCKEAHKIVLDFWQQEGVLKKECKYCLLSPIRIQGKLFPEFKGLTFKLPHLLSSRGMIYQGKDGVIKNAKCVYNWNTSTFYLRVLSEDITEFFAITPCSSSPKNFTIQKEVISSNDHYSTKMSIPSLDRNVWRSKHAVENNYFLELENATPLRVSQLIPSMTQAQILPNIAEKFDQENSYAQKFGSESSFFPSLPDLPTWEEVKEKMGGLFTWVSK